MSDPFSTAVSSFVKTEDLLDRLVLVIPKSVEERESNKNPGETYESVTCDVIVLDGPTNDKIEEVPTTLEDTFLSGARIVGQIKSKIRTGGMVLGRVVQVPTKFGGTSRAWALDVPTEQDKELARPAAKAYLDKTDPFTV